MIIPNEKYIEMIIGLSKSEKAYEEMLSFIEKEYPNYQIDFVINPNNAVFRKVLERRKAKFETEQQKMIWCNDVIIDNNLCVQLITPEYENQYKMLHSNDVYWTAEKVLGAKEIFRVFIAIKDESVVGYLDVTYCYEENEPYSLFVKDEFVNSGYEQALLYHAIQLNKPKKMMVLVDIDSKDEIKVYESVGFKTVALQNSIYATYKS